MGLCVGGSFMFIQQAGSAGQSFVILCCHSLLTALRDNAATHMLCCPAECGTNSAGGGGLT